MWAFRKLQQKYADLNLWTRGLRSSKRGDSVEGYLKLGRKTSVKAKDEVPIDVKDVF